MKESHANLVYHSAQHRRSGHGCLVCFLLLGVALLAGVVTLVRVEMVPPLRPAGVGELLYRRDALLETQIRERSPLPLRLPRYIAPLRQDEGVMNLPLRRELKPACAPEELPFPTAPDSVVLNRASLLELPPAQTEEAEEPAPAPAPETPAATQPAAPAAAPAFPEPASAALQGKEVA